MFRRRLEATVLALAAGVALLAPGATSAAQSANLDQCANGTLQAPVVCLASPNGWQNGDLNPNNSHYREGDSVPFRTILTGLTGSSHTLVIQYDTLAGGKHAFDYLTRWDRTVGGDPCSGVSGCSGAATSAATIPLDPLVGAGGFSGAPLPDGERYVSGWNAAITGVSLGGGSDAAGQQSITIAFSTSSSTVVVAWGAHVAAQLNWGAGNGAGAINGSPYHVRIVGLDGRGGNEDRSMKASVVAPVPTSFETDASSGSLAVGGSVTDTATLSGPGGAVTGVVSFSVCGPSLVANPDCSAAGSGTAIGDATIGVAGQATSPVIVPTSAGNYCFRAVYTPDASGPYSPSAHTNQVTETSDPAVHGECFTVLGSGKATPTLTTTASGDVPVGGKLHDTAHLSGGSNPGGTINFKLYGPDDANCSGTPIFSDSVAVTRNGDYASRDFTTGSVGSYRWTASYSGDTNNSPATGGCNAPDETAHATELASLTKTTPSATTVTLGGSITDTAAVSGDRGVPSGTVRFFVCGPIAAPSGCADGGTPVGDAVALGGGKATSSAFTPAAAGVYCFRAVYGGNFVYLSSSDGSPDECFTVTTQPSPPPPRRPGVDLRVVKLADPNPVTSGGTLTYTIVATNGGPDTAHGVVVTDSLPSAVTLRSASSTQGTCSGSSLVTCAVGTLATGESATVTIVVTPAAAGTVVNTAIVGGNEVDTNPANNIAIVTTVVEGFTPPSACYTLVVTPRQLIVGRSSTIKVLVRQSGRPVRGVVARVVGAGVDKRGRTGANGIARIRIKPRRPGILQVRLPHRRACATQQIGVIGVFAPPLAG